MFEECMCVCVWGECVSACVTGDVYVCMCVWPCVHVYDPMCACVCVCAPVLPALTAKSLLTQQCHRTDACSLPSGRAVLGAVACVSCGACLLHLTVSNPGFLASFHSGEVVWGHTVHQQGSAPQEQRSCPPSNLEGADVGSVSPAGTSSLPSPPPPFSPPHPALARLKALRGSWTPFPCLALLERSAGAPRRLAFVGLVGALPCAVASGSERISSPSEPCQTQQTFLIEFN